jgi:probable phosphoglycerate mutase
MIYLIRQGETDWNLFKRANGITDTFLNKTGIEQAKSQADNLKNVSFDVCFCSPLTRTRQFCEIIYKGQAIFDNRLTEIDCGEFDGMEETAEMWESFFQAAANGDKGVEELDDFMKRNFNFCDMISEIYQGKNVLLVTHAANVRAINFYFIGKPKGYNFNKTPMPSGGLITFEN